VYASIYTFTVTDIDDGTVSWLRQLTYVNLTDNPLSDTSRERLDPCRQNTNIEF